jgi:hypothetical protein
MTMTQRADEVGRSNAFSIDRWSATSGSERQSRANLVIDGGGRQWRANAIGNGAVDALMRAVDEALAPALGAGVELVTYDVHATGHGHAASARVDVTIRDRGPEEDRQFAGTALHPNVLEASTAAYLNAINALLAEKKVDVAAAAPLGGGAVESNDRAAAEARRRTASRIMQVYND